MPWRKFVRAQYWACAVEIRANNEQYSAVSVSSGAVMSYQPEPEKSTGNNICVSYGAPFVTKPPTYKTSCRILTSCNFSVESLGFLLQTTYYSVANVNVICTQNKLYINVDNIELYTFYAVSFLNWQWLLTCACKNYLVRTTSKRLLQIQGSLNCSEYIL